MRTGEGSQRAVAGRCVGGESCGHGGVLSKRAWLYASRVCALTLIGLSLGVLSAVSMSSPRNVIRPGEAAVRAGAGGLSSGGSRGRVVRDVEACGKAIVDSNNVSLSSMVFEILSLRSLTFARSVAPLVSRSLIVVASDDSSEAIFFSSSGKRRFVIWPWLLFVVECSSSKQLVVVECSSSMRQLRVEECFSRS